MAQIAHKRAVRAAALLPLLLAVSGTASAQFTEFWFSGGESLISNGNLGTDLAFGGNQSDYQLTDGFRFALRATFNNPARFGHEVFYSYSRTQLRYNPAATETGMAIHQGGYNFLLYATREGWRIRPFATGGLEFANYVPPGSSAASGGGDTKFGFNYGAGMKMRLVSIFGLRLDFRQYTTPKPFNLYMKEGWIRQNEISAGIGVLF
jgi:opacity protein-like surface antigen